MKPTSSKSTVSLEPAPGMGLLKSHPPGAPGRKSAKGSARSSKPAWTAHPDAAIASVTRIEALGFAGISPEEEMSILDIINACPAYPLDEEVIKQAILLRQHKKMKLSVMAER